MAVGFKVSGLGALLCRFLVVSVMWLEKGRLVFGSCYRFPVQHVGLLDWFTVSSGL